MIHTLDELRAWYSRNGATMKHTNVTNRDDNTVVNRLLNRNQPMDVIIKNTVSLLRKYLMGFDAITYPCELNKAQNPLHGYITDFYYHLINTLPKLDEKKDNRDLPMLTLLDKEFVDTSLAKINDFKNIRKDSKNPMYNTLNDYAELLQAMLYETQTIR